MSEDLISREKAYEVLSEYYHHRTEMQHKALREALDRVPPVDIDLSDYSDRLWRNAYEQGRAEAEAEIIHCRDCEWYKTNYTWDGKERKVCAIEPFEPIRQEEDYCSFGERKDDAKVHS